MKKAFTLIELLAVIIILAFLLMIVSPRINKIINESTEKTDLMSVKQIVTASEQYYGQYRMDDTIKDNIDNENNVLDELEMSGKRPEGGTVIINKQGQIKMAVVFNEKCYKKTYVSDDILVENEYTTCTLD